MGETKENTGEMKKLQNSKVSKGGFCSTKKAAITVAVVAIVTILIIIAIILIVYFTQRHTVNFIGNSNGIQYSTKMQENSEMFVVMKNETGKTVSELKLTITYFDIAGKELGKKTSISEVFLKNDEVSVNNIKSGIINSEEINEYNIEIIPSYYEGEDKLSSYEKVEMSEIQEQEDVVTVNVKNKTEQKIERLCFYAVFFNEDRVPIDYSAKDLYSLNKEGKTINFDKPKDKEGNKIEYEFCKVYIKY